MNYKSKRQQTKNHIFLGETVKVESLSRGESGAPGQDTVRQDGDDQKPTTVSRTGIDALTLSLNCLFFIA